MIESCITDHFPVYISIPEIKLDNESNKVIRYRLITENGKRKFKHAIARFNADNLQQSDAKEESSNFIKHFNELYDKYFPICTKTITHKDETKPWIDDILINQMKIRDKLYKLATRKRIDIQIYNKFRNIMTNRIKKAKAKYYEDEFKKTSLNIKKTWSTINSVIRKNKFKSTIQLTDNNGTKVLESDVSTEFVDYFTNIATNLTNQLPNSPTNPIQYLRSRNISSFVFFCTNAEEIEDIVDDLKDNGTGLNKISNSILKYSNKEISQILSKIINKCIYRDIFPKNSRQAVSHLYTRMITRMH